MLPEFGSEGLGSESFPLTGQELGNWLRTSGSFLFTQYESGIDLLNALRENGLAIRTQDFYQIRRDVLYSINQVDSFHQPLSIISADNPDSLIPLGYTAVPTWERQSSEFLYRVTLNGYDPKTGDSTSEYMMVGSDFQLTFNEVHDLAGSYIPSGKTSAGNIIEAITLDAAYRIPS